MVRPSGAGVGSAVRGPAACSVVGRWCARGPRERRGLVLGEAGQAQRPPPEGLRLAGVARGGRRRDLRAWVTLAVDEQQPVQSQRTQAPQARVAPPGAQSRRDNRSKLTAAVKVRAKPRGARGQMESAMLVPARRRAFPGTRLFRDSSEHAVDVKKRQLRTAPCLARDVFREALPPLDVRLSAREHRANAGARTRHPARASTLSGSDRSARGRAIADGDRDHQGYGERCVRSGHHGVRALHARLVDTRGFGAPSTAPALQEPSPCVAAGSKTAPFVTRPSAPVRLISDLRPAPYRRTSIYRYGAVRDLPRPG